MQLNLGTKIRELRHRDGRTQEALAEALGVTSQAVSRWKSSGSYPDVEIIPSIANYFSANDPDIITKAISILVLLHRNFGENEKAVSFAMQMPELKNCREIQLAAASDGKEEAKYIGEFLFMQQGSLRSS